MSFNQDWKDEGQFSGSDLSDEEVNQEIHAGGNIDIGFVFLCIIVILIAFSVIRWF